jgi:hypothetical protein
MHPYREPEPVYGDTVTCDPAGTCEGCGRSGMLALVRLEPDPGDHPGMPDWLEPGAELWRPVSPATGFCAPCAIERCLARGEELPYATHPALWDPEDPGYDPPEDL